MKGELRLAFLLFLFAVDVQLFFFRDGCPLICKNGDRGELVFRIFSCSLNRSNQKFNERQYEFENLHRGNSVPFKRECFRWDNA